MIAVAAAAQCWLGWRFIPKTSLSPILPCLFLFIGTFCFYGLHDFFTKVLHAVHGIGSERGSYWLRCYKWLIPLVALGLVSLPALAWKAFSLLQLSIFFFSGLLAITYSFPIIPFSTIKRWKEHGLLKIIILSGVWTGITLLIWLPGYMQNLWILLLHFCFRFFYLLLLCIPFDVRDHFIDSKMMNATLVETFSIGGLQKLSIACANVCAALLFFLWFNQFISSQFCFLLMIHLWFTLWLVLKSIKNPDREANYFWLDAQLIVQALLVGLGWWLA